MSRRKKSTSEKIGDGIELADDIFDIGEFLLKGLLAIFLFPFKIFFD